MINEKGNILVTVIFMMVILLIVAMGISSIGSGGVENSVLTRDNITASQYAESVEKIVRNGTDWTSGNDDWVRNADISLNVLERNRLELKVYIDNRDKNIDFTIPALTSASAIYLTALKNNLTGFNISMISGPTGAAISGDISINAAQNYSRMIAPCQAGSYRLSIDSPDSEEYIVFVRVFCKE